MLFQRLYLRFKELYEDEIEQITNKEQAVSFVKRNFNKYTHDINIDIGRGTQSSIPIYKFFESCGKNNNSMPTSCGNIIIAYLDYNKTCCEAYFIMKDGSYYIVTEAVPKYNKITFTIRYLYDPSDRIFFYKNTSTKKLLSLERRLFATLTLYTKLKDTNDIIEKIFEISNTTDYFNTTSISVGDIVELNSDVFLIYGLGSVKITKEK